MHIETNCLSEICFTDAEDKAEELDHYLKQTGRTIGPLHGLPVSLKDRFNVDSLESACGYVSWLGPKKNLEDEGTLVKKLRQLGAVFFVKTSVPMSMLVRLMLCLNMSYWYRYSSLLQMGETANNITGSTVNPYNRNLSAGGASGGELIILTYFLGSGLTESCMTKVKEHFSQ